MLGELISVGLEMRFIIVRPEVQAFGQAMEQVLAENGWVDVPAGTPEG